MLQATNVKKVLKSRSDNPKSVFRAPDFQGGQSVILLPASGSAPLDCWKVSSTTSLKSTQNSLRHINRVYSKELRGYCCVITSGVSKLEYPNTTTGVSGAAVHLLQPYLVLQVNVPRSTQPFNIELCTIDHLTQNRMASKRRFFLSTATKIPKVTPLHASIPLNQLRRDEWINCIIDMRSLVSSTYRSCTYQSLENIAITGKGVSIRSIFTLRYVAIDKPFNVDVDSDRYISVVNHALENLHDPQIRNKSELIPRALQFSPTVDYSYCVIRYGIRNEIGSRPSPGPFNVLPKSTSNLVKVSQLPKLQHAGRISHDRLPSPRVKTASRNGSSLAASEIFTELPNSSKDSIDDFDNSKCYIQKSQHSADLENSQTSIIKSNGSSRFDARSSDGDFKMCELSEALPGESPECKVHCDTDSPNQADSRVSAKESYSQEDGVDYSEFDDEVEAVLNKANSMLEQVRQERKSNDFIKENSLEEAQAKFAIEQVPADEGYAVDQPSLVYSAVEFKKSMQSLIDGAFHKTDEPGTALETSKTVDAMEAVPSEQLSPLPIEQQQSVESVSLTSLDDSGTHSAPPTTMQRVEQIFHSNGGLGVFIKDTSQRSGDSDAEDRDYIEEDDDIELVFDETHGCYMDPKTNKYYELME
ncbi:hypothetical protein BKA69DRAFT_1163538 [Paraphysoderma sedebokerense]|nr:hypothetical protein BKA69DRAFT_1163538 [Paraphysoderma sedebokerense]